jgi:hypothetical protein
VVVDSALECIDGWGFDDSIRQSVPCSSDSQREIVSSCPASSDIRMAFSELRCGVWLPFGKLDAGCCNTCADIFTLLACPHIGGDAPHKDF